MEATKEEEATAAATVVPPPPPPHQRQFLGVVHVHVSAVVVVLPAQAAAHQPLHIRCASVGWQP
eukprot:3998617-Pleurochrysis_carterae.AAC.1